MASSRPVIPGNHDVGDQQVDVALILPAKLQRLRSAGSFQQRISVCSSGCAWPAAGLRFGLPPPGWFPLPAEPPPPPARPAEVGPLHPARAADRQRSRSRCPGGSPRESSPPLCCTMPYTVDSPRPVPIPNPLVVKNGSNTCGQRFHADAGPRYRQARAANNGPAARPCAGPTAF